ncbi:MAG: hypothetical protein GY714_30075, partial [Desulfobacterales bacterium]|nr:hypothetical protein [Desulfobacterales bacterium]
PMEAQRSWDTFFEEWEKEIQKGPTEKISQVGIDKTITIEEERDEEQEYDKEKVNQLSIQPDIHALITIALQNNRPVWRMQEQKLKEAMKLTIEATKGSIAIKIWEETRQAIITEDERIRKMWEINEKTTSGSNEEEKRDTKMIEIIMPNNVIQKPTRQFRTTENDKEEDQEEEKEEGEEEEEEQEEDHEKEWYLEAQIT